MTLTILIISVLLNLLLAWKFVVAKGTIEQLIMKDRDEVLKRTSGRGAIDFDYFIATATEVADKHYTSKANNQRIKAFLANVYQEFHNL